MLKRSLFILVASLTALVQTNVAFAELKIGVFDNRTILENLPIVQQEFKKLNAEFEPKRKELADKQKTILALKEDIEKNAPILSDSDRRAKELEFNSKVRELNLLTADIKELVGSRQNEVTRQIQGMIEQEVLKIAKNESYDLIIRSGVMFASAKVDITNKILTALSEK